MRELDARLHVLEDAHENGEIVVSTRLANLLAPGLPDIGVGTPISDALEAVFHVQEALLEHRISAESPTPGSGRNAAEAQSSTDVRQATPSTPRRPTTQAARPANERSDGAPDPLIAALDMREAELLTQRIKTAINQVCLLLAEAHDRRAWVVLGYSTWAQYVRQEFGYSRSRSYEILDQAKMSRAVQAAAGTTTMPDVSPYAARQIKPYLSDVVDEIRQRVATDSRAVPDEIIKDALAHSRATPRPMAAAPRRSRPPTDVERDHDASASPIDRSKLFTALEYIAGLPTPSVEFIAAAKLEPRQVDSLRSAIGWLTRFAQHIDASIGPSQSHREDVGLSFIASGRQ